MVHRFQQTISEREERAVKEIKIMQQIKEEQILRNRELDFIGQETLGNKICRIDGNDLTLKKVDEQISQRDQEIEQLQHMVKQQKSMETQKLDVVRDKAKLLTKLIKNEDIDEFLPENGNSAIGRDIQKIFNSYK